MTTCCCPPSVTPGPTPNNPVGPLAPPVDFDPTITPTPALAGLDVSTLTAAELAVSGRLDGTVRTATGTVATATVGDTISGTVAGAAFGPVTVTPGDDDATAADVAAAINGLAGGAVTCTSSGADFDIEIAGPDNVGIDVTVTAGGTAVTLVMDAETCRLRIFRRRAGGVGQLDGWQVLGAYGGGPRADYAAPFDIGDGFAPVVLQLAGMTALYPYTTDLAGDSADGGSITYRAYATLYPLE